MEKDFHYYLIYCIAAVTQHRDAQIMASSMARIAHFPLRFLPTAVTIIPS
jgi:hypothetical protein